eukprot:snap_masked-scaffold_11-processed-gene-1.34-mRNA-1 protein AED:1.00 eAED:1.00 QI:0/-1/0/0/-1/1/1/0/102
MKFRVKVSPLSMLKAPSKPSAKYSCLLSVYRELCTEAKRNEEVWKKAFSTALKMCDALENSADGFSSDFFSFLSLKPSVIKMNSSRKQAQDINRIKHGHRVD